MIDIIAGSIVLASSAYAVWTKDMLASAIALGVAGFATALYFLALHAPDVAMAEAAVGAGIVPLILIATLSKTERMER
ncbi:MAG: hydrogenase subunit MbhD domain-containing protein [Candidatus Micrarchaeota archaeon]